MTKEPVAKQDLERMAMQQIQAYPGCELISDVEIEYAVDEISGANWMFSLARVRTWRGFNTRLPRPGGGCGIGTAYEQSPDGPSALQRRNCLGRGPSWYRRADPRPRYNSLPSMRRAGRQPSHHR